MAVREWECRFPGMPVCILVILHDFSSAIHINLATLGPSPMENGLANVGVCLLKEKAEGIRDLGLKFLRDQVGHDFQRWRGGLGAPLEWAGRKWHHHAGIVSCGDAALWLIL